MQGNDDADKRQSNYKDRGCETKVKAGEIKPRDECRIVYFYIPKSDPVTTSQGTSVHDEKKGCVG